MKEAHERHDPIRQSVRIDCPVEDAFQLFTEGFGRWWPLASYSQSGSEAQTCEMEPWEGGRVFERSYGGEEWDWGSVVVWDPPSRVEFTWNPAGKADDSQTVNVEFEVEADGTRVTVTHSGWHQNGVAVSSALARFGTFTANQMLVTI